MSLEPRDCEWCGKRFTPDRKTAKFCPKSSCSVRARNARRNTKREPRSCANSICPIVFTPLKADHLFHSEACAREARAVVNDPAGPLGRIASLLENAGITAEDIGRVEKVKLSEWEGFSKDAEGDPQVTPLHGVSVVLSPSWETGPAWPVIEPAKPTIVRPVTTVKTPADGWRTAVVLPDPQIGFRLLEDEGEFRLDPFHDELAIECALMVARAAAPDLIVNLGDTLDFPEFGKYLQEPAFQRTTQASIDRAHLFLAGQRAVAPDAQIVLHEGNHDARLTKAIMTNAAAAFGLRQAARPDSWPVLSVPHLLRLDELNVEYLSGYPASEHWINDNLRTIHGLKVRSAASTAAAVVDDERVSTIFGHVHRIELQHKTRHTRYGPKQNFAATPGCLCRIDGAVPSVKGATDLLGRPITSFENWQQGVGVVSYQEGDGGFALELVPIHAGRAVFRGRVYAASV